MQRKRKAPPLIYLTLGGATPSFSIIEIDFFLQPSLTGKWQHRQMPGLLNRHRQLSLVVSAITRYPAGKNLPALSDILSKPADLFIINSLYLINTKRTDSFLLFSSLSRQPLHLLEIRDYRHLQFKTYAP